MKGEDIMDRGEYWLIDSVIDSEKPLHWLHPSNDDLTGAFNRRHHGLSYEQLMSTLMKLFREEYLVVHEYGKDLSENPRIVASPTESLITRAFSREVWLQYAVTKRGG